MTRAFEKEYNAEAYLFDVVGPRFQKRGQLSAYDFFLIVRWTEALGTGDLGVLLR